MRRALPAVRSAVFTLTGLGCLTASAWIVHPAAGLATAGPGLLLLEWLTHTSTPTGGDRP